MRAHQEPPVDQQTEDINMRSIDQIDKAIKANHRQLRSLEKITPLSAESWQIAWDKHPELRIRENDLYRERGESQLERNACEPRPRARENG